MLTDYRKKCRLDHLAVSLPDSQKVLSVCWGCLSPEVAVPWGDSGYLLLIRPQGQTKLGFYQSSHPGEPMSFLGSRTE